MAHFDTAGLEDFAAELVTQDIDVVRVGYSDLMGTERGRDVLVNRFARTVGDGVAFCRSDGPAWPTFVASGSGSGDARRVESMGAMWSFDEWRWISTSSSSDASTAADA